LNVLVEILKGI